MYLVNNRAAKAILRLLDFVMTIFVIFRKKRELPPIQKILVCNIAHLGDVVLSTSLLPWISSCYPNASISFLVGSWSKELVQDHTYIDRVHVIDHWKLDRSSYSLFHKIKRYVSQRKTLIRELKQENYDLAVDLYPFFPNAISWISRAHIPIRLGFTSAGFGPCLTHSMHWEGRKHIVSCWEDLLSTFSLPSPINPLLPCLHYKHFSTLSIILPEKYYLFHVGSGDQKKEWDLSKWCDLVKQCKEKGIEVLLSGRGAREKKMIEAIGLAGGIDLCDQLSLKDLIQVIQKATAVVTVDSVAGHIASAFQIPSVVLFSGMNQLDLWAPRHLQAKKLFTAPSCFPCYKKGGCSSMACIQEVSVKQVLGELCSLGL